MPSAKVTADMICPIKLSPDETQMIIDEAERILTETLAAHELFVSGGRTLPQDIFKLAKTKEHIQVYRSRKPKRGDSVKKPVDCPLPVPKALRSRKDSIEQTLMSAYDFTASGSSVLSRRSSNESTGSYQSGFSPASSARAGLGNRVDSISSVSSSSSSPTSSATGTKERRYASGSFHRGASSGSLCANCGATFNKVEVESESGCEDNGTYASGDSKLKSVVFC
ncbi:hypothetical protein PybrP1_005201, partial [[Pythium] brassicae (nom. inval.)]